MNYPFRNNPNHKSSINIKNKFISESIISVIIVSYNGEYLIEDCLNSVINSNYHSLNIIVVDNNSLDRTKDIIREYKTISSKNHL